LEGKGKTNDWQTIKHFHIQFTDKFQIPVNRVIIENLEAKLTKQDKQLSLPLEKAKMATNVMLRLFV
jgi:hypothetical protein